MYIFLRKRWKLFSGIATGIVLLLALLVLFKSNLIHPTPKTHNTIQFNNKNIYPVSAGDILAGKGIPNTTVQITISPNGETKEVKTDQKGKWLYTVPTTLKPEIYHLSIVLQDKYKKLVSIKTYTILVRRKQEFKLFSFVVSNDGLIPQAYAQETCDLQPQSIQYDCVNNHPCYNDYDVDQNSCSLTPKNPHFHCDETRVCSQETGSNSSVDIKGPDYDAWNRMMRLYGVYPDIENGEVMLYSRDDWNNKFCNTPSGCIIQAPTDQEQIIRAQTEYSREFIIQLHRILNEHGYLPQRILEQYFPGITASPLYLSAIQIPIQPSSRNLGGCGLSGNEPCGGDGEMAGYIRQAWTQIGEQRLNFESPVFYLQSADNVILGGAIQSWGEIISQPPNRVNDETRLNALLGLTIIQGESARVIRAGERLASRIRRSVSQLVEEGRAMRNAIREGPVPLNAIRRTGTELFSRDLAGNIVLKTRAFGEVIIPKEKIVGVSGILFQEGSTSQITNLARSLFGTPIAVGDKKVVLFKNLDGVYSLFRSTEGQDYEILLDQIGFYLKNQDRMRGILPITEVLVDEHTGKIVGTKSPAGGSELGRFIQNNTEPLAQAAIDELVSDLTYNYSLEGMVPHGKLVTLTKETSGSYTLADNHILILHSYDEHGYPKPKVYILDWYGNGDDIFMDGLNVHSREYALQNEPRFLKEALEEINGRMRPDFARAINLENIENENIENTWRRGMLNYLEGLRRRGWVYVYDPDRALEIADELFKRLDSYQNGVLRNIGEREHLRKLIRNNRVIIVKNEALNDQQFKDMAGTAWSGQAWGDFILIKEGAVSSNVVITHEFIHTLNPFVTREGRRFHGISYYEQEAQADKYGALMAQIYELWTERTRIALFPEQDPINSYAITYPNLHGSLIQFIERLKKKCDGCLTDTDFIKFALTADHSELMVKINRAMNPRQFMEFVGENLAIDILEKIVRDYVNRAKARMRAASVAAGLYVGSVYSYVLSQVFSLIAQGLTLDENAGIHIEFPTFDEDPNILKDVFDDYAIIVDQATSGSGSVNVSTVVSRDGAVVEQGELDKNNIVIRINLEENSQNPSPTESPQSRGIIQSAYAQDSNSDKKSYIAQKDLFVVEGGENCKGSCTVQLPCEVTGNQTIVASLIRLTSTDSGQALRQAQGIARMTEEEKILAQDEEPITVQPSPNCHEDNPPNISEDNAASHTPSDYNMLPKTQSSKPVHTQDIPVSPLAYTPNEKVPGGCEVGTPIADCSLFCGEEQDPTHTCFGHQYCVYGGTSVPTDNIASSCECETRKLSCSNPTPEGIAPPQQTNQSSLFSCSPTEAFNGTLTQLCSQDNCNGIQYSEYAGSSSQGIYQCTWSNCTNLVCFEDPGYGELQPQDQLPNQQQEGSPQEQLPQEQPDQSFSEQ